MICYVTIKICNKRQFKISLKNIKNIIKYLVYQIFLCLKVKINFISN